jgi:hypothetical protein
MMLRRDELCGGLDARMQRMCPDRVREAALLHTKLTPSNSLAGRKIAAMGGRPWWKSSGRFAQGPS